MVRWSVANSSSGPLVMSTRSAFLAGGSTCAAAGWNASRLPTVIVIASVRSSPFMDVLARGGRETNDPSRVRRLATVQLPNRRIGNRSDAADRRCAGRKRRRGDEKRIPLGRRITTRHALTRERIPVGIRFCEPVREGLQEGDDLVLLLIRQAEITGRHVDIVLHLGHRPAVHFFGRAWRAVP